MHRSSSGDVLLPPSSDWSFISLLWSPAVSLDKQHLLNASNVRLNICNHSACCLLNKNHHVGWRRWITRSVWTKKRSRGGCKKCHFVKIFKLRISEMARIHCVASRFLVVFDTICLFVRRMAVFWKEKVISHCGLLLKIGSIHAGKLRRHNICAFARLRTTQTGGA